MLGGMLAAPVFAAPTDQAVSLFKQYCMGTDGDLDAAIKALDSSKTFGHRSGHDGDTMRYASFTGPSHINASVKIGFATIDDHCTIILQDVADPMGTSQQIAQSLAAPTHAEVAQIKPFDDYGKGGYGIIGDENEGDILVAPLADGIRKGIVHINYFP
ncbi:hypothetical protein D3260_03425 [Salinisphaera sp. Q1T1-3]|nr:hypothetical protein D3260_03425 [Salinisphaera sp. Q1T1-3]